MRFACQSCGKAYNLPEERIAEKSNVKLKCRVCGAIVEVKKQGELVAQLLDDGDGKRGRVSEAPAPLASLGPDDSEDDTRAIALGDQLLSEQSASEVGGLELESPDAGNRAMAAQSAGVNHRAMPAIPPAPATGFSATPVPPPLSQHPSGGSARPEVAMPPLPDPLGLSSSDSHGVPPLPVGFVAPSVASPPPPPLLAIHADDGVLNGSNGALPGDGRMPLPLSGMASPVSPSPGGGALMSGGMMSVTATQVPPRAEGDDTTMKMLAALVTGMLIGFIIARLFF
jgi:hypothetical protein